MHQKYSYGEMVDRTFHKIRNHMGWDAAKTRLWFMTSNPHFGGMTPDDFMLRRPDKFERIVDALISESSREDSQPKERE